MPSDNGVLTVTYYLQVLKKRLMIHRVKGIISINKIFVLNNRCKYDIVQL